MLRPVTISRLMDDINRTEYLLYGSVLKFWELIKIVPEQWQENTYGDFWVAAIFGNNVLWFDDIEEGWIYSSYHKYSVIDAYQSGEYKLRELIEILHIWISSTYDEVKP